jgi:hypothetical protein
VDAGILRVGRPRRAGRSAKNPVVATEYQNVPSAEASRAMTRAQRGSRSVAVVASFGFSVTSVFIANPF